MECGKSGVWKSGWTGMPLAFKPRGSSPLPGHCAQSLEAPFNLDLLSPYGHPPQQALPTRLSSTSALSPAGLPEWPLLPPDSLPVFVSGRGTVCVVLPHRSTPLLAKRPPTVCKSPCLQLSACLVPAPLLASVFPCNRRKMNYSTDLYYLFLP